MLLLLSIADTSKLNIPRMILMEQILPFLGAFQIVEEY